MCFCHQPIKSSLNKQDPATEKEFEDLDEINSWHLTQETMLPSEEQVRQLTLEILVKIS